MENTGQATFGQFEFGVEAAVLIANQFGLADFLVVDVAERQGALLVGEHRRHLIGLLFPGQPVHLDRLAGAIDGPVGKEGSERVFAGLVAIAVVVLIASVHH